MAEYLEQGGFGVHVSHSAKEAITATQCKNYSLVITDLRMETGSDEDGLNLIRHLRRSKPGLPIFILTASGAPEAATESYRLNVDKFIGKPIMMSRLLATVRDFLADFYKLAK